MFNTNSLTKSNLDNNSSCFISWYNIVERQNQKKKMTINVIKTFILNGKTIKCKDKENTSGQMEEFMKVNIKMTKKMVLESSSGKIIESMKDNGKMENNMAKELLQTKIL